MTDTLELVRALTAMGVVRATFSIDGALTSFEVGHVPTLETEPAPAPPAVEDDITIAANRLMGRR